MRQHLWTIAAILCFVAAAGFAAAYIIGGFALYIAVAALWVAVGCVDIIAGARLKKKDTASRLRDDAKA
jgi:hypothetical protein